MVKSLSHPTSFLALFKQFIKFLDTIPIELISMMAHERLNVKGFAGSAEWVIGNSLDLKSNHVFRLQHLDVQRAAEDRLSTGPF